MRGPGFGEDVRNLVLIGGAGVVGLACTGAAAVALFAVDGGFVEIHEDVRVTTERIGAPVEDYDGSDRIWATVRTEDGDVRSGFLRWDRNEATWADLLDAYKVTDEERTDAGVRFGNIDRIEKVDSDEALLTLRDGSVVEMEAEGTDLGNSLRGLYLVDPEAGSSEYRWREIESVEFSAAPASATAPAAALHGTLRLRNGDEYTGYLAWDVDEVLTSDILDGESNGVDMEIAFGAIEEISRESASAARVRLRDGREMVLRGTNDVNSSITGISISDPGMGQLLLDWGDFDRIRLHPPEQPLTRDDFAVSALTGRVETEDGSVYAGQIAWDRDEAASWEVLDGVDGDVRFAVELSQVSRIEKRGSGAEIELKDGRTLRLSGSNDVDSGNRGIVVEGNGTTMRVPWSDFRSVRFDG